MPNSRARSVSAIPLSASGFVATNILSATRSRALPEAWLNRPIARSMSRIDFNSSRIEPSRSGSCTRVGNHLLPALEFRQIAQRLQNPGTQLARAHRRDRSIENSKQAGVPRVAGFDQFEIGLGGSVEKNVIGRRIATKRVEMIDLSPQLMFQVMNDRAGGADRPAASVPQPNPSSDLTRKCSHNVKFACSGRNA